MSDFGGMGNHGLLGRWFLYCIVSCASLIVSATSMTSTSGSLPSRQAAIVPLGM